MKRAALAAVAALTVVLLAGCTAPAMDEPIESADAVPLVAETPAAAEPSDGEAAFLDQVREALPDDTVIPDATDEQLLMAGQQACDRMAAGEDGNTMSVIEGEQPNSLGSFESSATIISFAAVTICVG